MHYRFFIKKTALFPKMPLLSEPSIFNIRNMPERLEKAGDLFRSVLEEKQRIDRWLQ